MTAPTLDQLRQRLADFIDAYTGNVSGTYTSATWVADTPEQAADHILDMLDPRGAAWARAQQPPPAPHLSRDELVHIVEHAMQHWAAVDGPLGEPHATVLPHLRDHLAYVLSTVAVDALHEAGALPMGGEPT